MNLADIFGGLKKKSTAGEGILTYELMVGVGKGNLVLVQMQGTPAAKAELDDLYALILHFGAQLDTQSPASESDVDEVLEVKRGH